MKHIEKDKVAHWVEVCTINLLNCVID